MEIPEKLEVKDLLSLYEGRRFPNGEQPKLELLNIDQVNFEKRTREAAEKSFKNYLEMANVDGPVAFEREKYKRQNLLLACEVVDPTVPLTLVVLRVRGTNKETGESWDGLTLDLYRDEINPLDSQPIEMEQLRGKRIVAYMHYGLSKNELEMRHREVWAAYRRQKIGDKMMQFAEAFQRQKANEVQTEQVVTAEVAQLDVICWYWNNGYRPRSKEDEEKLQRVLSGDQEFCLGENLYVFPKSIPEEKRNPLSMDSAIRIKFEKKIVPREGQELTDNKHDTRSAVEKIVPL